MVNPDRIKALCHPEVFKRVPELKRLKVKHTRNLEYEGGDEFTYASKGGDTTVVLQIGETVFTGIADCSLKDNFCKKTGRELAFKRAIRKYWDTLPLDVRRIKLTEIHEGF